MSQTLRRLKTFGVVAVLSGLVWVLAESQTLRTESLTLSVTIKGESDNASLVRINDASWSGQIELTIEGSAASVSDARDRLGGRVELMVGRELPSEAKDHVISLVEALRRTEALLDSGVSIAEVRPETLAISVVRVAEVQATVMVRAPAGRLEGAPRAEPAAVTIRGPKDAIEGLVGGGGAVEVVAPIDDGSLDGLLPGVPEVLADIRLELPEALRGVWGVSMSPETVDVTVQVRTRTRTHTIPRLPVQVVLPPPELGRWLITLAPEDTDLFDVTISGPSEGVDQVISGAVRPMAIVSLSFDELERGITSKTARIVLLPPGVSARVEDAEVGLTIERVEEPEAESASP